MRKTHLAVLMGLALVGAAGTAAAAYAGESIWGANNPGQGATHAHMPAAGLQHNQAGAHHPPEPANGTGQPDDVPPADAGQPDSLPDQANPHADSHYPPSEPGA